MKAARMAGANDATLTEAAMVAAAMRTNATLTHSVGGVDRIMDDEWVSYLRQNFGLNVRL